MNQSQAGTDHTYSNESPRSSVRVGVVFGGRSSEHEVSLSSANNVMDALVQAGYQVVPMGITPQGRWLSGDDPMQQLRSALPGYTNGGQAGRESETHGAPGEAALSRPDDNWALLPNTTRAPQIAPVDVIFPVLHGPYGEDGAIQGLLEMANLPYIGCGVASSAVAMDKVMAKQIFAAAELPQTRYRAVLRGVWRASPEEVCDRIEGEFDYPFFVKPANLGSSVGVSKVDSREALPDAIDAAARYDRKILVEEAVANAREIEVSVLGNDAPRASVPGEIIPGHEFYDYDAKYLDDSSQLLIPARLDDKQTAAIQEMALRAFTAIDGTGLARVDFLLDDKAGQIYLNEVNTMPGFTRISMYPKLWEASGLSYPELVDQLVQLALERYTDRQQNQTTR